MCFWSLSHGKLYLDYDSEAAVKGPVSAKQVDCFLRFIHEHNLRLKQFDTLTPETFQATMLLPRVGLSKYDQDSFLRALHHSGASALDHLKQKCESQERILAMRLKDASEELAPLFELAYRVDGYVVEYHSSYAKKLPEGFSVELFAQLTPRARQLMLHSMSEGYDEAEACNFAMQFLLGPEKRSKKNPLAKDTLQEYAEAVGDRKLAKKLGKSYVGRSKFKRLPFSSTELSALVFLALAAEVKPSVFDAIVSEAHEVELWSADDFARYFKFYLEQPQAPASWRQAITAG